VTRKQICPPENSYVEREVAHLDTSGDGTIEIKQTAGYPELWRLLRTLFKDTDDTEKLID
jgi:hypothetical protein